MVQQQNQIFFSIILTHFITWNLVLESGILVFYSFHFDCIYQCHNVCQYLYAYQHLREISHSWDIGRYDLSRLYFFEHSNDFNFRTPVVNLKTKCLWLFCLLWNSKLFCFFREKKKVWNQTPLVLWGQVNSDQNSKSLFN